MSRRSAPLSHALSTRAGRGGPRWTTTFRHVRMPTRSSIGPIRPVATSWRTRSARRRCSRFAAETSSATAGSAEAAHTTKSPGQLPLAAASRSTSTRSRRPGRNRGADARSRIRTANCPEPAGRRLCGDLAPRRSTDLAKRNLPLPFHQERSPEPAPGSRRSRPYPREPRGEATSIGRRLAGGGHFVNMARIKNVPSPGDGCEPAPAALVGSGRVTRGQVCGRGGRRLGPDSAAPGGQIRSEQSYPRGFEPSGSGGLANVRVDADPLAPVHQTLPHRVHCLPLARSTPGARLAVHDHRAGIPVCVRTRPPSSSPGRRHPRLGQGS